MRLFTLGISTFYRLRFLAVLLFAMLFSASAFAAGLSGTYTVGASGNYTTLTAAIADLNTNGVAGPVTFLLTDASYSTSETFPIVINQITGASATNRITIKPAANVSPTITGSGAALIKFNGADFITIDGSNTKGGTTKDLSLVQTSTASNTATIWITNSGTTTGSTQDSIKNLNIQGGSNTVTTAYGIYVGGTTIGTPTSTTSTTFGANNDSLTIQNNSISKAYGAIIVRGATTNTGFIDKLVITQNSIGSNTSTDYLALRGIDIQNTTAAEISKNTIFNVRTTLSGNSSGIELGQNNANAVITKNNISGISNTSTSGYGSFGINVSTATGNSDITIDNNMISDVININYTSTTLSNGWNPFGIRLTGGTGYKIYYNSVHLTGTPTIGTGNTLSAALLISTSTVTADIRNNTFSNTMGGTSAAKSYAIYLSAASNASTINFNNYYVSGSNGILGYLTSDKTSLSAWQAATSQDANSKSGDPKFVTNTNLHSTGATLNASATPITGFTTDIDGNTRNTTTPDIGADEYTPILYSAAITALTSPVIGTCSGTRDITLTLNNKGVNTIDSFTVSYYIGGVLQSSKKYYSTIASGNSADVKIGTISLGSTVQNFKAFVSLPNGSTDPINTDDTISANLKAALSGTYTIGTGKDYATFTAAVNDMTTYGVCSAVTFKVDNGTYQEKIRIPEITGASATNTITFQSASGDSSKVILTQESSTSSTDNYTLFLDGADYIRFSKITVSRTGTNTNGKVVEVSNGATNNIFSHNQIIGVLSTASSTARTNIYSSSNLLDNYNMYLSNYIKYGSYAMYIYGGSSTSREKGTVISGNIIDSAYAYGLYTYYQDSITITKNKVSNLLAVDADALYLNYINGTSATPALVANNMISVGGTSTNSGIYLYYSQYVNVYYNSINNYSTGTGARGIYLTSASTQPSSGIGYGNINLRNNNIANTGGGLAIEVTSSAVTLGYVASSNYNNLYTTGTNLVKLGATNYTSLSTYQTASSQDANSVNVDPKYKSANNLHTSALALDDAGTPIAGITEDFDGQTRSSSTPDIGADEFTAPALNANLVELTAPTAGSCAGTYDLKIHLRNEGRNKIDSAYIAYTINGLVQSNTKFTLSLNSLKDTILTIGSITLNNGTKNNVKIYLTKVNGSASDNDVTNDTLNMVLQEAMNGNYTIGTGKDYTTFTATVNDLKNRGVCGAVTFDVENGTYNEQISIPQIGGTSATNTVLFRSKNADSSKVILQFASTSADNYVVQLNGADYVTFKQMSLISTSASSSNARVVELKSGANFNNFTGNYFKGYKGSGSTSTALVYSPTDKDTNNTFTGNYFKYGNHAIYVLGSSTNRESGLVIKNNIVDSAYTTQLYTEYQVNPVITGNKLFGITSTAGHGIYLANATNGATITNNSIIYKDNGWYGIYLLTSAGTSTNRGLVANNFISIAGTSTSIAGIHLNTSQYFDVLYNSVFIPNTATSSRALLVAASSSTSARGYNRILNNIFANTGGGHAFEVTAAAVSSKQLDTSDYNDIYATSTILTKWNGTNYSTLSAYKTASNQDPNSISADPKFRSNADLHIKALNSALDGKALALSNVTTDYDGQTRNSSNPDIGADEYDALANDLNIVSILKPVTNVCGDSNTVLSIIITNEGSSNQSSYNVGAVVTGPNGTTTLIQSSSRAIASDARDTVTFSTKINTYAGGSFTIKAYTALSTDGNGLNDTTTATYNFNGIPAKPGITDVARCGNGSVKLNATTATGNTILWYTAPTGGTSFATGTSYTTPKLFATTTYYVSAKSASGCEGPRTAIKAIVNPIPTGANIAAGTIFNGTSNAGTSANPDEVCPGSMITYNVTPPTNYNNSGYNTTWNYSFNIKTASGAVSNDTSNILPTTSANGVLGFTPAFALSDSMVILTVTVKDAVTNCDSTFSRYIHIAPAPKIAFSMANRCGAGSISFTNNTTISSGTISYVWYFGDGDTSSAQNPTHAYVSTGTYTVKLVAANSNSCKDSLSKTVTVYPVPTAAFSANNGCTNNAISFSNASTVSSGTLSYLWTFGDGTSSTATNPAKAFSSAGTYAVKLVVTGDGGCKDSVSKNITIDNTPQTGFTKGTVYNGVFNNGTAANPDIVCALYTLTYDITTPTGYSNSAYGTDWEISQLSFKTANGTAAADTSVTLPSSAGPGKIIFTPAFNTADSSFVLSLTIKNKTTGCDTTITRYISVLSAPDADFTAVNACAGEGVAFTDKSVIGGGTGTYKWYFGDGNTSTAQNPSHIYSTAGTYTVSQVVTVGSGCNDSVVKTITVYPRAVPDFSFVAGCRDSAVVFTDASTIATTASISSYAWYFGDGNTASTASPTHTYSTAGTYTVKMVVTTNNGCKDSVSKSVTVNPLPKPTFTYVTHCADSAVSFTNTSSVSSGTIVSYTWKFGDGSTSTSTSPSHTYTGSGNFTVTLIATSNLGCKDSVKQTITVYPKPKVSFTASNSCLSGSASFTNTSTIPTGFTIASYLWKFGDGTTATSTNPTHKYSAAGTYTVTLIATSLRGCTDSVKNTVTIYPQPVSNFTFTNRCLDSTISFTNSATVSSGTIVSYLWNFGNNSTSTSANPTKAFSAAGTYSVKLVVTTDKGCKDSITKSVTVYPKPVVSFSSPNTCITSAASFTDKTTLASGTITAYLWRFGDGGTSTAKNPTHTYATAGKYNVTLRVTTSFGCVDSTVVTNAITIFAQPSPSFTQTNRCVDSAISFTSTSTVTDGTITGYSWDFGDGSNLNTSASPSYTYAKAGDYTVKLTVTSSNGCTNSISKKVTVYPKAVVGFTSASAVCLYDSISFANTSTIASGYNIIGYKWSFGDGNTATTTNAAHKYAASGKYTVILSATTANGCVSTYSQDITINALPQASFTSTTVCETGTTVFTNTSVAPSQGALNYTWNFGDGTATSGLKSPSHKYATGGNYNVSLIVRNAGGCSDTVENTIKVNFKPVASFVRTNGCAGQDISFANTSSIGGDSITSYIWTFGDGANSTDQNPKHAYNNAGRYTVRLIVASDMGCSDTVENTVTIFAVPSAGFTATTACEGSATQFKNSISSSAYTYKWNFGDGDSSTLENPLHQYAAAGTYSVTFTVRNQNGCATTVTQNVKVNAKPVAGFSIQNGCFGDASVFTNTSSVNGDSIVSYEWTFGDGTASADMSPSHVYANAGTYTVLLRVSTATCSDTISQQVTVHPKPVAAFSANDVCLGNATLLTNNSTVSTGNIVSNLWVIDNKDTSTAQNPTHTFATAGKHNVTLFVVSDNGCTDSVSHIVTVNALPNLAITHTTSERNVKFNVSDSSYTSYSWTFGDNGTSTDKNPTHRYPAIGNYNVTLVVRNANGCEATFTDTVNITTNSVAPTAGNTFNVEVYPNPFKEATTLVYNLNKTAQVRAAVYDIQGREITVLVNNLQQTAGKYTYTIQAEENHIQSGVYMLRVIIDGVPVTKQIIRVD